MSFSVTVVLGQEYLPHRLGIASGVMLGTAIGVGGVAAVLLGTLADAAGLNAVMWTIAALPVPALALALSLPRASRPSAVDRHASTRAAGRPPLAAWRSAVSAPLDDVRARVRDR
jgi:hypothetical protein